MLAYASAIACFVFFIYTGYDTARNTEFISLSENDGECSAVTRQNTGTYLATDEGYWEGDENYNTALTIYRADFFSLDVDTDEYKAIINRFRASIEELAILAETQDAARNIMYWITYELSTPQYLFQMTGNSVDVFYRYYTIAALASREGVCDIPHTSTLDGGNHLLRIEYPFTEYMAESKCTAAATPSLLGFNPDYDFDTFRVDLDLNSLLIAIAVCEALICDIRVCNSLILLSRLVSMCCV